MKGHAHIVPESIGQSMTQYYVYSCCFVAELLGCVARACLLLFASQVCSTARIQFCSNDESMYVDVICQHRVSSFVPVRPERQSPKRRLGFSGPECPFRHCRRAGKRSKSFLNIPKHLIG